MRSKFQPMAIAAVYSFAFPTIVGCVTGWMALDDKNIRTVLEWQTLIAGVLAIFAALLGGSFVYLQTMEQRRQNEQQLERKHAAARSVLPLALSGMTHYAQDVAKTLESLRAPGGHSTPLEITTTITNIPRFDHQDIEVLRGVVESADQEISDRISDIISEAQIMNSRMMSLASGLMPGSGTLFNNMTLDDYSVCAATIYARCNELFSYARREKELAPSKYPTWSSLKSALRLLDFDEDLHADMFIFAERRATRWAQAS